MNLRNIRRILDANAVDDFDKLSGLVLSANGEVSEEDAMTLLNDEILLLKDQMSKYPYLQENDLEESCIALNIENNDKNKELLFNVCGANGKSKENGSTYKEFLKKRTERTRELIDKESDGKLNDKEKKELKVLKKGSNTNNVAGTFKSNAKRSDTATQESKTTTLNKKDKPKDKANNGNSATKEKESNVGGFLKSLGKGIIKSMEDYNKKHEWYFPSNVKQYHFLESKK